jgi:hypothetical protein
MKTLKIAALLALFAVPAAAQEADAVANPGTSQEIGAFSAAEQGQLRRNLREAGFEHIDIEAVAYVVRARSGDGKQIVFRVDPQSGADALSATETDDITITGSISTGG